MSGYYKKFRFVWFSLLAVFAVVLTAGTFHADYQHHISLLTNADNAVKYIVITVLVIAIPLEFTAKSKNSKAFKIPVYCTRIFTALALFDLIILSFADRVSLVTGLSKTPDGTLDAMIYMAAKSRKMWINGLVGTVEVSVLGTIIGFLLAILLVFMRVNPPHKHDKGFIQLIKTILYTIEKVYVSIVRGTPMMVQGCVIYYAGFMVTRSVMM